MIEGVRDEDVDEFFFSAESRVLSRAHDRAAKLLRIHRSDEDLIRREQRGERAMLRTSSVEVRPHRDHDRDRALGLEHGSRHGVEERLSFGVVGTCGEDLLELIDRDHGATRLTQLPHRAIQLLPRMVSGADDGVRPPIAARQGARPERMEETSTQQRRLPTARRTDECEEPPPDEVSDRLGDHVLPAEEELSIFGLESRKSLIGADVDRTN